MTNDSDFRAFRQMKQALLIGCGNIGFRHLQAIGAATADLQMAITVIEPNPGAHPRIRDYLATLGHETRQFSQILPVLPNNRTTYHLAIIATNSAARRAAFDSLIARHVIRAAIFEKVLFPTLGDLDAVGSRLGALGIPAFVNCGRRTAPGYLDLLATLASTAVDIDVSGSAYGLGSNAIHFLDLAEFLNASPLTGLDASGLLPGSVRSKREGYVEIFGTLRADLANGARLSIHCDDGAVPHVQLILRANGRQIAIDETGGAIRNSAASDPQPFVLRHVSELTETYVELLCTGKCALTPYEDSARQHRFFLDGLLRHFDLDPTDDAVCPVS